MFYMNNDMSLEDMKLLFSHLAKGFDAATFDSCGRKTLAQLHRQIADKDLTPIILSKSTAVATVDMRGLYDYALRRSNTRVATINTSSPAPVTDEQAGCLLVMRMTVKVHIECGDFELLETMRGFSRPDGTEEMVHQRKDCANTETRKIDEGVLPAAVRTLWEENGLVVSEDRFEVLTSHEIIGDIHPSTVYPPDMVLSQQIYQAVRLMLPERLWKDGREYVDDGVRIRQEWFPIVKRKEYP